jgi:hypothetical protein
MAGPFADDSGAMIIFDVPDRRAADVLVAADSNTPTGSP